MKLKTLEYQIINECKCGFEELFVLISLVNFERSDEREDLVKTLHKLFSHGLFL